MQPITRRRRFAVAAAVCALALLATVPAEAVRDPSEDARPPAKIVKTRKIAPGLKYTKIVERKIPRRTFILTIDPSKAVTLDAVLAESSLPARRELSRIVNQNDALAGINGDYSGSPVGDPVHPMMIDGELLHTASQLGVLFAISADERQVFFDQPEVRVTMTNRNSGESFRVNRWNQGPPMPGELAGFTPLGGSLERPPSFSCSVRLLPTGPLELAPEDGVNRDFQVDAVACSEAVMERNDGIVISAPAATDEATQLLALSTGTPFRLHWTVGWPGVLDAVGGAPLLLQDDRIVGQCNSACGSQPRTGIGVTAGGRILLVVVDGRQPRWSLGPTMSEFARIMKNLGAVTALNMDGGGSSTMVVEGEVVNRPSDGHQRLISNAVLVLPGPDPGEA